MCGLDKFAYIDLVAQDFIKLIGENWQSKAKIHIQAYTTQCIKSIIIRIRWNYASNQNPPQPRFPYSFATNMGPSQGSPFGKTEWIQWQGILKRLSKISVTFQTNSSIDSKNKQNAKKIYNFWKLWLHPDRFLAWSIVNKNCWPPFLWLTEI